MGGAGNTTRHAIDLTATQARTNNGSGTCAIAIAPNSTTAAVVAGGYLLTLDGSGNFSFGNGINNGSGGLAKNGAGTASLVGTAGLSTGTGIYTINNGILDVTTFANGGLSSGLGASPAAGNLVFGGGTLRHSPGNVAGTDRLFTIGNTATLDSSAAANGLAFTGTGSILFDNTFSTTHTLTLTGALPKPSPPSLATVPAQPR